MRYSSSSFHIRFFPNLLVLCLSKHARLLNCLLHDPHGIPTSSYGHGGTDIVSARLLTPMRYTSFTPTVTFADILSRKDTCHAIVVTGVVIPPISPICSDRGSESADATTLVVPPE